jgi:hypothetical protein
MSLALVAIVLAICAGAVVAVSSRESGVAAIGLAVALVAAALLSEPLPTAPILGVRVVAALLVATIIRSALRGGPRQPSPLGWPAEALLATAGAVAGLGVAVGLAGLAAAAGAPLGVPVPPAAGGPVLPDAVVITGLALTVAAATALLAIGISPLVHGRAGGRRAIGLVLVTQAVLLLRVGIAGPAVELEEIARAALLVVSAATGAALASAAARGRTGPNPEDADEPDPGGRRPIAAR